MIRRLFRKFFPKKLVVTNPGYHKYNYAQFMNVHDRYKKYQIGDYTYGAPDIFDWAHDDDIASAPTTLKIGKFCSIADAKIVLGSEHRPDWVSTYPFNALSPNFRHIKGHPSTRGDVTIGNDVWIATGVTILSGVTIGDGAVVGANSLVIKDVPPYTMVGGVPAKVIKKRFSDEIIAKLEKIKWWDLPIEVIEEHVELLQSANVDEFIKAIARG
jgi:acetyltransferase-like isoleucine patch superfamily enzyme